MSERPLITASEIGRYHFCARALAYDYARPQDRASGRWWRRPLPLLGFGGVFGVLALSFDLLLALAATGFGLAFLLLGRVLWQGTRRAPTLSYYGKTAKRNRKSYIAPAFGLTGRPDYLLPTEDGVLPLLNRNQALPLANQPHEAHILQVLAHCLLLAEATGYHPPCGVLRYADGSTFEVDFSPEAVEALARVMDDIEALRSLPLEQAPVNHQDRGRCFACRHRKRCPRRLFP
jgi:hypothetical protein